MIFPPSSVASEQTMKVEVKVEVKVEPTPTPEETPAPASSSAVASAGEMYVEIHTFSHALVIPSLQLELNCHTEQSSRVGEVGRR